MREWFDRCDDWERRRLIQLSAALPEDEQKAWLRSIRMQMRHDTLASEHVELLLSGGTLA